MPVTMGQVCRRDSDAGSPAAEGSSERLRQLLNRSGLESDGEEDGSGAAGSDDDDDDADEDLDAMASGLHTRARPAHNLQWIKNEVFITLDVGGHIPVGDAVASQLLTV